MSFDIKLNVKANVKGAKGEFKGLASAVNGTSSSYSKFYNQNRKVNNALSNITKDANRASAGFKGMTKAFSGFNQMLGMAKFYAVANTIKSTVKASLDSIETTNLFAVSMGDATEETYKFLQEMSAVSGLDITNLESAVGTFGLLARSMGMSSTQAQTLAVNTGKLAVDLSSLMNVPINQVMADLRSGLVGQSETVYKYGMDVTEAGIKQEALRQGISKSVREMSQGEKMALRYAVMIRQSSLAHGDFARTIDTPANQLKILHDRFITLARAIGNIFIPALSLILPYANAVVKILTQLANTIATFFGYKPEEVKGITSAIGGIADNSDDASTAMDKASKSAKKMKQSLLGIDEINLLPQGNNDSGGSGGAGGIAGSILPDMKIPTYDNLFGDLSDKTKKATEEILNLYNTIKDFVKGIPIEPIIFFASALGLLWAVGKLEQLSLAIAWLGGAIYGLKDVPVIGSMFVKLTGIFDKLLVGVDAFIKVITGMSSVTLGLLIAGIALVIATIVNLWKTNEDFRNSWIQVWENIKGLFVSIWETILNPIFYALLNTFMMIWEAGLKPLWDSWKNVFAQISGIMTTFINLLLPIVTGIITVFAVNLMPYIQSLLTVFGVVFSGMLGAVKGAFDSIGSILSGFKTILNGVITFVTGVFTGNWRKAFQGLSDIIGGIFEGLGGIIKLGMNSVIGAVNGAISGLNKIQLPDWDIIPKNMRGKGLNLSLIPKLARGGMLDGGTLFQAGEFGKAEVIGSYNGQTTVMPLENTGFVGAMYDAVYGAVVGALSEGGGSSGSGDVVLMVGNSEFGRIAIDSINKVSRQEGRLLLDV